MNGIDGIKGELLFNFRGSCYNAYMCVKILIFNGYLTN